MRGRSELGSIGRRTINFETSLEVCREAQDHFWQPRIVFGCVAANTEVVADVSDEINTTVKFSHSKARYFVGEVSKLG